MPLINKFALHYFLENQNTVKPRSTSNILYKGSRITLNHYFLFFNTPHIFFSLKTAHHNCLKKMKTGKSKEKNSFI